MQSPPNILLNTSTPQHLNTIFSNTLSPFPPTTCAIKFHTRSQQQLYYHVHNSLSFDPILKLVSEISMVSVILSSHLILVLPGKYFTSVTRENFCRFLFYLTNSIDICLSYFVHTGASRIRKFEHSLRARRSGDRIPFGGEIFPTSSTQPWGPTSRGAYLAVGPNQPWGPPSRGAQPTVGPTQPWGPPSRGAHPATCITAVKRFGRGVSDKHVSTSEVKE